MLGVRCLLPGAMGLAAQCPAMIGPMSCCGCPVARVLLPGACVLLIFDAQCPMSPAPSPVYRRHPQLTSLQSSSLWLKLSSHVISASMHLGIHASVFAFVSVPLGICASMLLTSVHLCFTVSLFHCFTCASVPLGICAYMYAITSGHVLTSVHSDRILVPRELLPGTPWLLGGTCLIRAQYLLDTMGLTTPLSPHLTPYETAQLGISVATGLLELWSIYLQVGAGVTNHHICYIHYTL